MNYYLHALNENGSGWINSNLKYLIQKYSTSTFTYDFTVEDMNQFVLYDII